MFFNMFFFFNFSIFFFFVTKEKLKNERIHLSQLHQQSRYQTQFLSFHRLIRFSFSLRVGEGNHSQETSGSLASFQKKKTTDKWKQTRIIQIQIKTIISNYKLKFQKIKITLNT